MAIFAICVAEALSSGALHEDLASKFAQVAREADSAVIEFYDDRKIHLVKFSDAAWIARLADVLQSSVYEPRDYCFCISYPTISLVRGNNVILILSVHHAEKLRITDSSNAMSDFHVGQTTGKLITVLALEKMKANQQD
ncbi:MAG TPA: hypothetical protein PKY38_04550 [Opitutaceae bacterium]|nr:hypothetical protein [Opitutaceae bacterium]